LIGSSLDKLGMSGFGFWKRPINLNPPTLSSS